MASLKGSRFVPGESYADAMRRNRERILRTPTEQKAFEKQEEEEAAILSGRIAAREATTTAEKLAVIEDITYKEMKRHEEADIAEESMETRNTSNRWMKEYGARRAAERKAQELYRVDPAVAKAEKVYDAAISSRSPAYDTHRAYKTAVETYLAGPATTTTPKAQFVPGESYEEAMKRNRSRAAQTTQATKDVMPKQVDVAVDPWLENARREAAAELAALRVDIAPQQKQPKKPTLLTGFRSRY
ncbi:MAG: hypothetical protein IMZ62_10445 [Chloroflexi bacterium]|nr:hypothetical protein [Chloroflexota bacterium]MBE3117888.1 hypothetical protein [Candidatus Atribacteria bacterium]